MNLQVRWGDSTNIKVDSVKVDTLSRDTTIHL